MEKMEGALFPDLMCCMWEIPMVREILSGEVFCIRSAEQKNDRMN